MVELAPEQYHLLLPFLESIPFNHLFARAVLLQTVHGRVYVDNAAQPRAYYIVHRYGMSLLGGDSSSYHFVNAFRDYALNTSHTRTEHEWMQAWPDSWHPMLSNLFAGSFVRAEDNVSQQSSGIIELNTRVNFTFAINRYREAAKNRTITDEAIIIRNTTDSSYETMKGSVVPNAFWNSSEDFRQQGISFSLYYNNMLAATAFSSFVAPGKLELGIETFFAMRGKRLAEYACAALIDYCIEHRLEPLWACRLENVGSYKLAQKLGFVPSRRMPYYRLSN